MATKIWFNVPSPDPMLTSHWWGSVTFTWEQFQSDCLSFCFFIYDFEHCILTATSSMGQWVKSTGTKPQQNARNATQMLGVILGPHCTLQWRHNERDGVSNHQLHDCLLNCLFRRRSKKTSKLRVTGLCEGNSPVTCEFPAQRANNAEMFPFDDVVIKKLHKMI